MVNLPSFNIKKFVLSTLVLLLPFSALAAEFVADDQLTLDGKEDVFAAGESLQASTTIFGDVFAAGSTLTFKDIEQDAYLAGETITIDSIGDDARIAGSTITINGAVGDDLFVAGETITLGPASSVGGELYAYGSLVRVNGSVQEKIHIGGDHVRIEGDLNGNVAIDADHVTITGRINGEADIVANILTVDGATFNGPVRYSTRGEVDFTKATLAQEPIYEPKLKEQMHEDRDSSIWGGMVFSILSTAVLLLILLLLAQKFFQKTGVYLLKNRWTSFFVGLIYFLVAPVLSLILMITVIGIPIAALILTGWIFSLWFSLAITALVATFALMTYKKLKWDWWQIWLASLLMYVVLKLVIMIPVIGWMVVPIAVCVAFGALLMMKKEYWVKYVR